MTNHTKGILWGVALSFVMAAVLTIVGAWAVNADRADVRARREQGHEAGRRGVPVEACPYEGGTSATEWKKGWQEGFLERQEDERQKEQAK